METTKVLALEVVQEPRSRPACCDCPPSYCAFSRARVYHYLIVWQMAERFGESFADVLRSESRVSQDMDPWIRGGRVDREHAGLIGMALEYARDHHGIALNTHNAERIAQVLCPERWEEEAPA